MPANKTKDPKMTIKPTQTKGYVPPEKKVIPPLTNYKPQQVVDKKTNFIIGLFVLLTTLTIYILTQARTMSFWDSGEYATCGSILGIPHPPGNPFYVVLARFFCVIGERFFSHAVLVAFISCLFGAFGALLTYLITVKLLSIFEKNPFLIIIAGLLAAFYSAFSYTYWMTSIEAEVNSGMLFFVNITLWLTLVWLEKSEDYSHQYLLLLIVYLSFLGFCVHQTALQIVPSILFIVLYPMIRESIQKGKFWLPFIICSIILIVFYKIVGDWGEKVGFPSLGKWLFALSIIGILYYNMHDKISNKVWLIGAGLIVLGFSPHIFLLVRSAARPFINEGYPHNLSLFMDYVLRRQYGVVSFLERRASLLYQYGYQYLRYFSWQWFNAEMLSTWTKIPQLVFTILGNLIAIGLGILGMFDLAKKNKHAFAYLFSVFIMTTIVFVFVLNLSDAEVRERDYFFVAAFNMWTIWMGIGAIAILRLLINSKKLFRLVVYLMFVPIFIMLASQYKVHDRSKEFMAVDYGMNFLNSLEENAIIFTNGDNDTFPLWYNQAVYDPYVKEYKHPAKDVNPDEQTLKAIKQAMAFKNRTLKGIRKDVSIANLSLLNTPWYIRQLRDREGIIFNWPDSIIENLTYTPPRFSNIDPYMMIKMLFKDTVGQEEGFTFKVTGKNENDSFTLTYPYYPTWKDEGIFRVSDLAVMKIIQDNYGKRPIYFAVTCEHYVGFERYTRNEGLVSRVVPTFGEDQLDIDRLLQNADKIYSYRSITDKNVYKDDNARRLIMNYGAAYDRASVWYLEKGDFQKAQLYLNKAMKFISSEFSKNIRRVNLYLQSKQFDKAYEITQQIMKLKHDDSENLVFLARLWYSYNPDVTFEVLEKATELFPTDVELAYFIYDIGVDSEQFDRSEAILQKMKENVGNIIDPYIDSLKTYKQNYQLKPIPQKTEKHKTKS